MYKYFTIIFIFFLALTWSSSADAAFILKAPPYLGLNSGLVGFWSFDGPDIAGMNAIDRSGNNNGILTNGPKPIAGRLGQALQFDGADDNVDMGDPADGSLDFPNENFSLSLWAKTSNVAGSESLIIKGGWNSSNDGYRLRMNSDGGGSLVFNTTGGGTSRFAYYANDSVEDGKWHHITITIVPNSVPILYIDSVQRASTGGTDSIGSAGIADTTREFGIGGRPSDDGLVFDGLIDEVRVYNKVLTPDEVKRLYRIGATLKLNDPVYTDTLNDGLVGFWSFDGPDIANDGSTIRATDRSGNGNHGTLTNGPKLTRGRIGQALEFDGDNDEVQITDSPSLSMSNDLTISTWVKPNTTQTAWRTIVQKQCCATHVSPWSNYGLFQSGENGTKYALQIQGKGTSGGDDWGTVHPGQWDHLACTFIDAANVVKCYQNGVETFSDTTTFTSSPADSIYPLHIGTTIADEPWDGLIDEVRIYNRVLTPQEIKRLYKIGSTFKVNDAEATGSLNEGLVGYWSFDDAGVQQGYAIDESGNSNHGTLTPSAPNGPKATRGRLGQALEFDGDNDHIVIANESNFDFEWSDTFSGSLWIKADPRDTSIQVPLSKVSDAAPFRGWQFVTNLAGAGNDPGNITTSVISTLGSTAITVNSTNDTNVNDGGWHHYTFTYDGSGVGSGVTLYEDGVRIPATVFNDTLAENSVLNNIPVGIGAKGDGAPNNNEFFNGLIDDVRIYNRLLTLDEIRRLYNLGR